VQVEGRLLTKAIRGRRAHRDVPRREGERGGGGRLHACDGAATIIIPHGRDVLPRVGSKLMQ
jgi:hypothetical protein